MELPNRFLTGVVVIILEALLSIALLTFPLLLGVVLIIPSVLLMVFLLTGVSEVLKKGEGATDWLFDFSLIPMRK